MTVDNAIRVEERPEGILTVSVHPYLARDFGLGLFKDILPKEDDQPSKGQEPRWGSDLNTVLEELKRQNHPVFTTRGRMRIGSVHTGQHAP